MYGRMVGRMLEGGIAMRCPDCGNRNMRKNYTRQRRKGMMQSWLCPVCGKSRTTLVPVVKPKSKKGRGVSIAPSTFVEEA